MSFLRSHRSLLFAFSIVILLTRGFLAFRPEKQLAERPYNDDSYYMMTVGRHIGLGEGFTIDGIHPTNGVQPLQCLVYGAAFYLTGGEKFDGVRLSFVFAACIEIFSLWAVYRFLSILRKTNPENDIVPLLGAGIWAFLFANIIYNDNGLETGLYIAVILASLWQYAGILRKEREGSLTKYREWILLGVLLGIAVLARIDAVFFVITICAVVLWYGREKRGANRIIPSLTIGIMAFVVSLPWWAFNYITFGSLMPISGQSESMNHYLPLNLKTASITISHIILSFFYIPQGFVPEWAQLLIAGIIIIAAFILWKRLRIREKIAASYELAPFAVLFIGSAFLVIYYTFFFSAPHFIGRYFHPLRLLALLIWPILLPFLYTYTREKKTLHIYRYLLYCFFGVSVVFNLWHYVYNFTIQSVSPAYLFAEYAKPHTDWKIGSTSSGTEGFILDNVINLDGKVNYDALIARKKNRIGEYAYEVGINVIADWRPTIDSVAAAAQRHGSHYQKIAEFEEMEVFKR